LKFFLKLKDILSNKTKEFDDVIELLEEKIKEKTEKIKEEKKLINAILDAQNNIVITTDGTDFINVNNEFKKFFNVSSLEEFKQKYDSFCNLFIEKDGYVKKEMNNVSWLKYILNNQDKINKVIIEKDGIPHIFTIKAEKFNFHGEDLITISLHDITAIENAKKEIEEMHKKTQDSIKYASLIQHLLLPKEELFRKAFKDYFIIWQPKDIVGGDIYLFEEIRKDEYLLFIIDATGHGVPGAFVTMMIKSIQQEIINNLKDKEVSTSEILTNFNETMKNILNQDSKSSLNIGFDAGVIFYNKNKNFIKFSGAKMPLFYIDNELKVIKGDRYSIGYKNSSVEYKFKEHIIPLRDGMKFYITTDGFIDQNGGEKCFPFGKKRFKQLIQENYHKSMKEQKEIFLNVIKEWQEKCKEAERNDDITLIGFETGVNNDK